MALIIDSNLWIDFTRLRTPRALKEFILPFILDPDVQLVEPVAFEDLRSASVQETKLLEEQLKTFG
jgi:hypothetical protein